MEEVTENIKETQNKLNSKGEQIEILKSELSTTSNKTAQLQAEVEATVFLFCPEFMFISSCGLVWSQLSICYAINDQMHGYIYVV